MADYTPLLTRAITGQDQAARQGIYARARDALERQLRGFEPKLSDEQIAAELAGLGQTIEAVEAAALAAEMPAGPTPATVEAVAAPVEAPAVGTKPVEDGAPAPEAPEPEAETPPSAPTSDIVEEDVLQAASTADVAAPELSEPVIPAVVRPRMPLREESANRRRPMVLAAIAGFAVMLAVGAIALTRRSSPDPLRNKAGQTQDLASVEAGKTEGRLSHDAPPAPAPAAPAPETAPQAGGAETGINTSTRAFMVLEQPGNAPNQIEGRAIWSFEPDPANKSQKALRVIIAYPGADITVDFSLTRNSDAALGASHLLMAIFDVPKGFEPVRELSPIEWRERESTQGSVLRGAVVPVQDNVFMLTLEKAAEAANMELLRSQKWAVFEFRLANGRRGAVLVEKGASGDKAVADALSAWKK